MFEPLIQRLERLNEDERGVSPIVGFVLIFALVMLVFTIYQAEVVPAQNADVEFKHSQAVEGEMSRLSNAIQQAGTSGVPQPVTVTTGVQYPNRVLAINPGAPVGTLATSDKQTVAISGLSGGNDYWSDGQMFDTSLISYQSNYNVLQQETEYVLENGMFVKNFENGNTLLASNGGVISNEGRRINLVLVGREYAESAMTTSVTVRPVSSSTEYLSLNATGSNPTVAVPTTLSENQWEELLNTKKYVRLKGHSSAGKINKAVIGLDKGRTYEIRITKVTLGRSDPPELAYLTSEDGRTNRTAAVGIPETFTVIAHDEFGNPYPGATVTATVNGSVVDEMRTNDEGRATFTYVPTATDANSTVEIELSIENGSRDYETVTYALDVTANENDGRFDENDKSNSVVETSCSAAGNVTLIIDNDYDESLLIQYTGDQSFMKTLPPNSKTMYTSTRPISYQVTKGPGNTERVAAGTRTCNS